MTISAKAPVLHSQYIRGRRKVYIYRNTHEGTPTYRMEGWINDKLHTTLYSNSVRRVIAAQEEFIHAASLKDIWA
jgi:hypothetical protein